MEQWHEESSYIRALQQRWAQQPRSMEAAWRKAVAAVMEGSSGEGEDRQDSFGEEERMEGVPTQ
eukprot:1141965-Pelagomonas_calceolata.AAC.3